MYDYPFYVKEETSDSRLSNMIETSNVFRLFSCLHRDPPSEPSLSLPSLSLQRLLPFPSRVREGRQDTSRTTYPVRGPDKGVHVETEK